MPHRRWKPADVVRLLEAVDRYLDEPFRLIVIGGSAVGLGYSVDVATEDIDAFETRVAVIAEAVERAREETGLAIPLTPVGVAEMPYNYQDRLQRVLPHLENLEVVVPDPHDLVLSKLARGRENECIQRLWGELALQRAERALKPPPR